MHKLRANLMRPFRFQQTFAQRQPIRFIYHVIIGNRFLAASSFLLETAPIFCSGFKKETPQHAFWTLHSSVHDAKVILFHLAGTVFSPSSTALSIYLHVPSRKNLTLCPAIVVGSVFCKNRFSLRPSHEHLHGLISILSPPYGANAHFSIFIIHSQPPARKSNRIPQRAPHLKNLQPSRGVRSTSLA